MKELAGTVVVKYRSGGIQMQSAQSWGEPLLWLRAARARPHSAHI